MIILKLLINNWIRQQSSMALASHREDWQETTIKRLSPPEPKNLSITRSTTIKHNVRSYYRKEYNLWNILNLHSPPPKLLKPECKQGFDLTSNPQELQKDKLNKPMHTMGQLTRFLLQDKGMKQTGDGEYLFLVKSDIRYKTTTSSEWGGQF